MAKVVFTDGHAIDLEPLSGEDVEDLLTDASAVNETGFVWINNQGQTVRINPRQVAYILGK